MTIKSKTLRANRRASNSLRKTLYRIFPNAEDEKLIWATQRVVTPFSGFFISDFYLSEEIDFYSLGWLNIRAKRMSKRRLKKRELAAILYCQVDQIENFISNFLPHVRFPFVFITGKWHLPSLKPQDFFQTLLSNEWLVEWYSQNQVMADLPIQPFPYGVNLETVLTFAEIEIEKSERELNLLVPFSTIHSHMTREDKRFREQLKERMQPKKLFLEYLIDLKNHKYVVCSPGDRMDTYRHWETIVCGGIPITLDSHNLHNLFQDSAVYCDDFSDISLDSLQLNGARNRREIASVEYWRSKIEDVLITQNPNSAN